MVNTKNLSGNKSKNRQQGSFLDQIQTFLAEVFLSQKLVNPHLLIAYSGGLDSTVLLHTLAIIRDNLPFTLSAMHVHHGLSQQADDWTVFCKKTCAHYDIPLAVFEASVDQNSGLGIEATARKMRYQALDSIAADFICLAQHQDDQAETLLLQLARGAGVKGLASMAQVDVVRKRLRPLLNYSRSALETYAKHHQLQWVEDESNADDRYDRNYLRHKVLPVLRKRYPNVSQTLSRSATHLGEANQMLADLALLDAETIMDKSQQDLSINLNLFKTLSRARQGNLMRWWLAHNQISMPSQQLLEQLLQQLCHAKKDAQIKVKVANKTFVMRYMNMAYLVHKTELNEPFNIAWQGEEVIILPDSSRLVFTQKVGQGFTFQRNGSDVRLQIKQRAGGERFKPAADRPSRTLKHVLQASKMPPWQREQLPLVFMDKTLVIIPNIGTDANFKVASDGIGLSISWQPY